MKDIVILAIVFFITWILAMIIWSIWLDGVSVAIAGVLTSGMLIGAVSIGINWRN